ncbi:MAG: hypothetical protein ACE5DI_00125 [Candidatus Micrarchaeia archaeon]
MPPATKEDVETVIDRLYDYVKINKHVKAKEAAGALGLPSTQVEKLAVLLEESNLIRIRYSLRGIELIAAEAQKVKKQKITSEKESVLHQSARLLEQDVMKSENVMQFMERDILRRLAQAENIIDELERKDSFSLEDVKFLQKEIETIESQMQHFSSEIAVLKKTENDFEEKIQHFKNNIQQLEHDSEKRKKPSPQLLAPLVRLIQKIADAISTAVNAKKPRPENALPSESTPLLTQHTEKQERKPKKTKAKRKRAKRQKNKKKVSK